MAYVYKQFTAQDKALIPFNAHKQYDFSYTNLESNSIKWYSSKWTSESISNYSSGSASADVLANVIKYNQIDKLFYRDYFTKIADKLGPIDYIRQPRNLYEKVNILSIPMGLYGNEVKPGSFYLSASKSEIIDDRFGNLMISGSNTGSFPNDIQENVFRLDPIKGFKKYDLGVHDGYVTVNLSDTSYPIDIYSKNYYRRGSRIATNIPTTYSSNNKTPVNFYPKDYDDSYFRNSIRYHNVTFNTSSLGSNTHKFPKINFNSITGSFVSSSHNEKLNFNSDKDFSISFWIKPKGITTSGSIGNSPIENGFSIENYTSDIVDNKKRYIISKSRIKTIHPTWNVSSSQDPQEASAELQFPYEIYFQSSSLFFDISDGNEIKSITTKIEGNWNNNLQPIHILCQNSGSTMELWKNGSKVDSTTISFKDSTRNTANFYIASSGEDTTLDQSGGINTSSIESGFVVGNYTDTSQNFHRYFNGDLNNINIWARAYNNTSIVNISESINASPYIGNIFYRNGFATITHPNYHNVLKEIGIDGMAIEASSTQSSFIVNNNEVNGINTLQFQGSHLIYEHEYQCTVQEHEFNNTTNLTARKLKSSTDYEVATFTTGSLFKPHVTTIGLYDNECNLLVIGKLGQPIKMSDETDTTFVLRWDT
jgi:hypothetical protein